MCVAVAVLVAGTVWLCASSAGFMEGPYGGYRVQVRRWEIFFGTHFGVVLCAPLWQC
jgi:hypothetical protein